MSLASLRYAIRSLARHPGLAVVATLTLGVSLGAGTAIYSAVQAVLLGDLPFRAPDRLAVLWQTDPRTGMPAIELSTREYDAWRAHLSAFHDVAAVTAANVRVTLTGRGEPEQVEAALVSPNFFDVLGVTPPLGRRFGAFEAHDPASTTALISEGLWQRRFGGDRSIVGQIVPVDGTPITIVGVLPPGVLPRKADMFFSTGALAHDAPELGVLKLVGRLRDDVTLEAAQGDVQRVAPLMAAVRQHGEGYGGRLEPFTDQIYGQTRPALRLLTVAVVCLLLIACANVANLLLARGVDRQRELALRGALGASRGELRALLARESVVLALGGGALGVVLAVWGVSIIGALIPADVPGLEHLAVDWRVLVVTGLVSLGAAVLVGLAPALQAGRVDSADALRDAGARATAGRRIGRVRTVLVAGQLAVSLGLVAGAGLAAGSFARLARLSPGFDPHGVVTAKILLSDKYADHRARAAFYRPLLERIAALPGVQRAGLVLLRPLADPIGWDYAFTVEGQTTAAQAANPHANYESISPDYFATVGIPLVEGRRFSDVDGPDAGAVAIVSSTMARRYWPGVSAIGKRIKSGPIDGPAPWKTVVGVVGDVRYREWTAIREDIYVPYTQWNFPRMDLVVRVQGDDPLAIVPALRAAVAAADPDLPLASVTTLERAIEDATAGPRFTAMLLGALALVALVVAAAGTFSVLAWAIERRTREIGVRVALGASRRDILRLIIGQAARPTLAGVVGGIALALAAGRGLAGLLYAVSPHDPATLLGSVALLSVVGIASGSLAARRALRIKPSEALRNE